jgi:hypothetical protein
MKQLFTVAIFIILFSCTSPLFSCNHLANNNATNNALPKVVDSSDQKVVDSFADVRASFLKMDTLDRLPDDFKHLIKGKIRNVFRVDFTGDGKPDYICRYDPKVKPGAADYLEAWITSDKKVHIDEKYETDYDYIWFVNLDNDREPEIFSATGWSDGIDYAFCDQDIKTGQNPALFFFNPVIVENGKHYWGYAWDITALILKKDAGKIFIQSSVDHDIEREDEHFTPDSTKKLPVIFFLGHSTQPHEVEKIRNIKWTAIGDLTGQ